MAIIKKGGRVSKLWCKRYIKITVCVIIAIFLLLLFWGVPILQVSKINVGNTSSIELFKVENEARKTIAQAIGGLAVLIGIYFGWRQISNLEKSIEVTYEGQITERFTRAIDQLGNEKIEVRLGGIYALERIARNSRNDLLAVINILTAHARSYTEMSEGIREREEEIDRIYQAANQMRLPFRPLPPSMNPNFRPPVDIVTIINSLGKVLWPVVNDEKLKIDLSGAFLKRLNLSNLNLNHLNFLQTNLEDGALHDTSMIHSSFEHTNFINAAFLNCNFQNSFFINTFLKEARFSSSCLRKSIFHLTDIDRAIFLICDLRNTRFDMVDLSNVEFFASDLRGADLKHTRGLDINDLIKINVINSKTLFPEDSDAIDSSLFHESNDEIPIEFMFRRLRSHCPEIIQNSMYENVLMGNIHDQSRKLLCQYCKSV